MSLLFLRREQFFKKVGGTVSALGGVVSLVNEDDGRWFATVVSKLLEDGIAWGGDAIESAGGPAHEAFS